MTSDRRWIGVALAVHLVTAVVPVGRELAAARGSGDFASYYYATQAAQAGQDPYDVRALSERSRKDGSRRTVQPFYYPPAFLITQLWAPLFSLKVAQWGMLFFNEVALGASLLLLRRFGVGVPAIALMLATFTPISENLRMLQANFLTLALLLAGLAVPRLVALVGAAAMLKMSPALLLLDLARRRRWRDIVIVCAFAAALGVVSLLLVGAPFQQRFYLEILPGFLRGAYHGIELPIHFPGNHSIPDAFARIWPARHPSQLSLEARIGSRVFSAAMLGLWAWRAGRVDGPRAIGALLVLMTLMPTFTWEPHLVFLLLPLGLLLTGDNGGFPARGLFLYALIAYPLGWVHGALEDYKLLGEVLHTFKTTGALLLFVAMLYPRSRAISAIPSQIQGAP